METKDNGNNIELERLKVIAELIRKNSANGKFTKYEDLLSEQLEVTEENINQTIESIKASEENSDIVEIKGKRLKYLYSQKQMTENYAKMMFRIEENDLLKLIVETVRYESETYPRPTAVHIFSDSPFYFTEDALEDVINQIKENSEYEDMQQTAASNGEVYLYSTKYLTEDYAKVLAEWIEVKQYENP